MKDNANVLRSATKDTWLTRIINGQTKRDLLCNSDAAQTNKWNSLRPVRFCSRTLTTAMRQSLMLLAKATACTNNNRKELLTIQWVTSVITTVATKLLKRRVRTLSLVTYWVLPTHNRRYRLVKLERMLLVQISRVEKTRLSKDRPGSWSQVKQIRKMKAISLIIMTLTNLICENWSTNRLLSTRTCSKPTKSSSKVCNSLIRHQKLTPLRKQTLLISWKTLKQRRTIRLTFTTTWTTRQRQIIIELIV